MEVVTDVEVDPTSRDSVLKEEFAELPVPKNDPSSYKRAGISSLIFFAGIIFGLVVARIFERNGIATTNLENGIAATANLEPTSLAYPPAQSASLRYQDRRFNSSSGNHLTEYEGKPSEAFDDSEKWHELYRCHLMQCRSHSSVLEVVRITAGDVTHDGRVRRYRKFGTMEVPVGVTH
ncbi:hypothetical protein BT96DRAFT_984749 [Gymnopus androsaceus JB14]|uniref:Uncharacterized protein n=1 Tax=Gymnopus androsaceus JB14 TaxID=1447944 RepID=A0A6A4IMQ3_9AGAR|nr:hypothetical protein BT96DRAFT_984749 [Gymnopus androsaceus JB14]